MAHGFRRPCFLRLESLGDRALPSVTWTDDGAGTVTITGDEQGDNIQITDNGSGGVTVAADDWTQNFDGSVTSIVVESGGGADTVTYTLADGLTDAVTRTVDVNLGNFQDSFTATLGAVPAGSDLTLNVNGGNGSDSLSVSTGDVAGRLTVELRGGNGKDTLSADVNGALSGEFFLTLLGGNGKDGVSATLAGSVTGTLDATLDGGNGKDTVGAVLSVDAPADGSTGSPDVSVQVFGHNGKDDLSLTVDGAGASSLTGATFEIDGGLGHDNFVDVTADVVHVVDAEFHG
jgi:hypothetical protein